MATLFAILGNLTNGGVYHTGPTRLRKRSQFNAHAMQSAINKEVEMLDSGDYGHQPTTNESKQKRGKSISASIQSADKVFSLFSFHALFPYGISCFNIK